MAQVRQTEWHAQWSFFRDEEIPFLLKEWIEPNQLEDFRGKSVLECGCGGGQHTVLLAPYAKEIVAVDLNTVDLAKKMSGEFRNVVFHEDDISQMDLGRQFDIVISIGVVHHTDNPEKTVENLKRHVKRGGKIILWVYSKEGNFLVEHVVEPLRRGFFRKLDRESLKTFSKVLTAALYVPVYSVYLLPLKFLPYYEYFRNFRRLPFYRNMLNIFDKLNAPQVDFISGERVQKWFATDDYQDIHISPYVGVSWRVSATKRS